MPSVRLIIAGTRPPKEIRSNGPALDQWYEDRADRVQLMVDAALKRYGLQQRDIVEEICGEAQGWDTLGKMWAQSNGIEVVPFEAEWQVNGVYRPQAGVERNGLMAMYAASDSGVQGMLVAAWDGKSKGTRNMVWNADKYGLLSWVWADENGEFDGRVWE